MTCFDCFNQLVIFLSFEQSLVVPRVFLHVGLSPTHDHPDQCTMFVGNAFPDISLHCKTKWFGFFFFSLFIFKIFPFIFFFRNKQKKVCKSKENSWVKIIMLSNLHYHLGLTFFLSYTVCFRLAPKFLPLRLPTLIFSPSPLFSIRILESFSAFWMELYTAIFVLFHSGKHHLWSLLNIFQHDTTVCLVML